MALDWKPTSQWFYAVYKHKGRKYRVNLRVKIEGDRPPRIHDTGRGVDPAFLESKGRAMQEHDRRLAEIRGRTSEEELTRRLIEIKTGERVKSVALADLADSWLKIPRKRKPGEAQAETCKAILRRFSAFVRARHPAARDLADVTRDLVQAFMEAEDKREVSARTWNMVLSLLRGVFRRLEPGADAYRHYLATTPQRTEDTIHREPFTPEELKAVLDAAQSDPLIRPVIVAAMCTAMRRGDVCLLKWGAIDEDNGFITVKTSKTGETVEIPVLPMLSDELKRLPRTSEYVFPEVAAMYAKNPDGIGWRLQQILRRAGFIDADTQEKIKEGKLKVLPVLPANETKAKALDAVAKAEATDEKKGRMRSVLDAYLDGKTQEAVADETGLSKGAVSGLLNEVEDLAGVQIIRRPHVPETVRGLVHSNASGQRLHRGSVKGWHSFRTTWITIALTAGVPIELVRKVTGHATADVVLKHYFKPNREDFGQAIRGAMPDLLTAGPKTKEERLREIIAKMTPKSLRKKALAILDGEPRKVSGYRYPPIPVQRMIVREGEGVSRPGGRGK